MKQSIYTFTLELVMKLITDISKVDRFDASWTTIEKREGQTLRELKSIATVRSVGASTRIEGSTMTDAEVEVLIGKLKRSKLEERDEQEVAGYFETLDTITEAFNNIEITEGNIKNLHKMLLIHGEKDAWHRGEYKQVSNAVEANYADGSKRILFKTAEPGLPTEDAMKKLIAWYNSDNETLPVIKVAVFVYDFLSIHPFQDGNGRLSRLLGTLLLLRNGYSWIQYVSFEHEIENRKAEYYNVLMQTQKQRPGEQIDLWLSFFLDCVINIQAQLMAKLQKQNSTSGLSPREKNILSYVENHPGCKSGEIARKLDIPLPTVKRILSQMVKSNHIAKYGVSAGTNYVME
ncbi:MAG: Fic family protein [Bacteroidia bacterium]